MTFTQTFPNFYCSLKPKKPPTITTATRATIPARDRVIDFGKYKGKMLGTLPSTYLKWVSKNLRAGNFLNWADLADQVLQDPVYKDRLEWEYADAVLGGGGNENYDSSSTAVSQLLEISERFGWDNEDKDGWRKVNFELLGTSKAGRIPRIPSASSGGGAVVKVRRDVKKAEMREETKRVLLGSEERRRRERRERMKLMRRDGEVVNEKEKSRGSFGNSFDDGVVMPERMIHGGGGSGDGDRMVEIKNPFPGRELLLEKVLNKKRFL